MALKKITYNGDSKVIIRLCEVVNDLIDRGGGHVIQDNGTDMTARANLNFVGATVTDDSVNDATVVTINDTTYTMTISGHTITLTDNDGNAQTVTVPDENTTYSLSISGNTLTLTDSDGNDDDVTLPDNNTTYTLSVSGTTITLTGSDGSVQTITTQDTTYSNATQSTAGLMSAADKTKLEGIASGADSVSWTQIQASGTKIAEIDINGTTQDVYAPNGGSTYTEGDGIDISAQNAISVDTAFTEASTRANIASGDTFSTILGKIKKFFSDLKTVAFTGAYSDLTGTPTIPTDFVSKANGGTFKGDVTIDHGNTSTSVESQMVLGNNIADGTVGASWGSLRIYGKGTTRARLMASNITAHRDFEFPNVAGTLALVNINNNFNAKQTINQGRGSTSTTSVESALVIGSDIADGTVGASYGVLGIYGKGTKSGRIFANNITNTQRDFQLPNKSGTFALTSDLTASMYTYKGALLHGGSSTIFGYGVAQICLLGGVATIDFEVQVTANDSSATFDYGIDRDYLTQLVGKAISPVAGGVIHYYTSAGALDTSHEGFGGTANVAQANKYWGLSRIYTQAGATGQWASSIFAVNSRITGRIYGTYT